ncbi:hypothetical protein [Sporanaerobacter sp. PP17-6a]|uniref:hypothetical protein n=1 Tax=Sporanaerobacter sp. PP17-6a TaxID=1891289 RepID=UPI00089FD442|nr:hypothetical protein [Sporanaerobacter sp. PP17-6a]SCL85037.1 hypothetical protein PP176A_0786 [Sporanaerobacter sp. PP17-6a]
MNVFTKDELIYAILHSQPLFNPIELLYEQRMDNNFRRDKEIGEEIKLLIEKIENVKIMSEEVYEIMVKINNLSKQRDKNMEENDRIMKILYGK